MNKKERRFSGDSEDLHEGSINEGASTSKSHKLHIWGTFRLFSTLGMVPQMHSSGTSSLLRDIPGNLKGKKLKELACLLEISINDSISLPLAYLESTLFDLCYEYYHKQYSSSLREVLTIMHPVDKLLLTDDVNYEKWAQLLEKYLEYNIQGREEYAFLCKFIEFLNDMCLVWDISNIYNYSSRFNKELERFWFLNLDSIYKGIINTEIIWLSIVVSVYPLGHVLNDEIKYYGELLQEMFKDTLHEFMSSNQNYVNQQDSIKPWLSFKDPSLHLAFSFPRPMKTPKPKYQELSINLFSSFLRKNSAKLKKQLEEFEIAYRMFENSLLLSFISIAQV